MVEKKRISQYMPVGINKDSQHIVGDMGEICQPLAR